MNISLIPFLFALQIFAIYYAARRAKSLEHIQSIGWILSMLGLLVIWGGISIYLALDGIYLSQEFLSIYPTLWLPFIPVVLLVTVLVLFKPARLAVAAIIDATPFKWLIGIHALRILAVGTLLKAYNGQFSVSFAQWVGIPDMMFGLSALIMFWLATKNRVSDLGLLLWNLAGVLVILPGAPIVGQRGLPGVFYASQETPSMVTLFEFPMVLAPSLVVPIFVAMNMFVAIRMGERIFLNKPI